MGLEFYLNCNIDGNVMEAFYNSISHNYVPMAKEANVYKALWHPGENGFKKAHSIVPALEKGLKKLKGDPDYFKQYNPTNGWGSYESLISFIEDVLNACLKYPNADIYTST